MVIKLTPETKEFIKHHLQDDATKLILQAKKYPEIPINFVVLQIQARQKLKYKLPEWTDNENITFESSLSTEQSSSEITAKFKAELVAGNLLIDLTGGMGVDIAYMSKSFENAIYLEQNDALKTVTEQNFEVLGLNKIQCFNRNSIEFLKHFSIPTTEKTVIYLDPARRNEQGSKVVLLQDCEPNILKIKELLFQKSNKILLKTSPMLDIDLAVNSLQNVSKVWVVAVDNEVKELLFLIEKKYDHEPELLAINLSSKQKEVQRFSFKKSVETDCEVEYNLPKKYLYEPNAALMKVGAFRSIAAKYSLQKIHPNSHLYTSEALVNDFMGRVFEVKSVENLDKKKIISFLPEKKANISTRNFPLSVRQIREKIGVQDGGNVYLIATTNCENQKIVLVCEKV